jgi:cyclopropane-fatty-acyl-phospholipid synthase
LRVTRPISPNRHGELTRNGNVGMFEHGGLKNLPVYFSTVHRLLKPA